MAQRSPGDERCKDCSDPHEPGRSRCAACLAKRREAQAELVAERKGKRKCVVCGAAAAADRRGEAVAKRRTTLCETHQRYYAERNGTPA